MYLFAGHIIIKSSFNPFLANVSILYPPPKNTRKPKVFCCFQGV